MKKKQDPLKGLQVPAPPLALRDRVLRAARTAEPIRIEPSIWTRVADNQAVRLAWAATMVALIGGHVWLSLLEDAQPDPGNRMQLASGEDRGILRSELELARIRSGNNTGSLTLFAEELKDEIPATRTSGGKS